MKASDLRIGNWVNLRKMKVRIELYQIDSGFDLYMLDKTDCFDVTPIPLTEEWLLKFGWVKENNYLWCEDVPYIVKMKFKKDGSIWLGNVLEVHFGSGFSKKRNNGVKYIHQLQNLYFALTGEELKLKTK